MEVDKIKFTDLFDGDPFQKANESLLAFVKSLQNLKNINKELAKNLKETLDIVSKTNVEELEKVEKLLKISQSVAKQNKEIENQKQKIEKETTKEIKKKVDLTFEELVNLQKAKIQKDELLKKAKEQAKEELGVANNAEKQIGAYAKLDKRLKELRQVYKDLAAEAAELSLTGGNEERIKMLTEEMAKLQPEITEIDKTLKQIDANVGQFNRQVGSYKISIVEAFDEVKKGLSDNAKAILGLDEKFDGLGQTISDSKEQFNQFTEAIKQGESRGKAFLNLLKNIGKVGILGVVLTVLNTLQASAQALGGVFEKAKDSTAGLSEGVTATVNKVVLLTQGLLTLDSNKIKQGWDINIIKASTLGAEVSMLTRRLELLSATANNTYGNIASDIETLTQIQNNAFKSDQERFKAAKDAFELQQKDIELRLIVLNAERELREKNLKLAIEGTKANKKDIDQFLYGNIAVEERLRILENLPTKARDAVLQLEETLGNIEVEQEKLVRNRVELQNFLFEKQFKNLASQIGAQIAIIKKNLEEAQAAISDNISFKDAISEIDKISQQLDNEFGKIFTKVLQNAGVNTNEFTADMIQAFQTAEELQNALINIGVGEEQRNLILDVFKDFKDESTKYKVIIEGLKKSEQEAIRDGLKRITLAKEALDIQEKEFQLATLRNKMQRGSLDYIQLVKDEDKLLFQLRNARIEQLRRNYEEDLKNKKLTDEQKAALELEYQEKINQVTQQYEQEREQREIERYQRVKQLTEEIIELERVRFENNINQKLQKFELETIANYEKIKKLYLDLQQIELDRLIQERDSLLNFAKTEEEKLLIYKKFNEKKLQLEQQYQHKIKELNKRALNEALDFGQKVLSETQNQISQNFQKQTQNIENQISILNDALERERDLANKGVVANVDELEKKIAELEINRREQAKREQAIQLGLAFINSVASYAKINPQTAVQNAFKDILLTKILASVIAGAFAEGVEGFQGKGSETSDSNLVLISKGESIITAKATREYSGLPTAMNNGTVEQWVMERYGTNIDVDALGNLVSIQVSKAGSKIVKMLNKRVRL